MTVQQVGEGQAKIYVVILGACNLIDFAAIEKQDITCWLNAFVCR